MGGALEVDGVDHKLVYPQNNKSLGETVRIGSTHMPMPD